MPAFAPGSLLAYLAEVPDPRSRRGRQHPLSAILGLVCCALLCGARGYAAIAQFAHDHDLTLMHRLGFTRRPPKRHGLRKVILRLDAAAFEAALTRWAEAVLGRPLQVADQAPGTGAATPAAEPLHAAALDGKALRGSADGLQAAVHLLALVAHATGLPLAQRALPRGADKTNEHKAGLRLVEQLVLTGQLVTVDAMFTHRDFCQAVRDRGGHYLAFVKDNQPTLLHDIQAALASEAPEAFSPSAAAAVGGNL
jgi:DDE_Tnp_1-associated/Transposase DDE domain